MKDIFEFLQQIMPLWLVIITMAIGYLIFLYTKLINSQNNFYKDKIDSIDKTTGIFERTVKHQESDLKKKHTEIESLKSKLENQKNEEENRFEKQLVYITETLDSIKDSNKKEDLYRIQKEILTNKKITLTEYNFAINKLNLYSENLIYDKSKKRDIVKLKTALVLFPHSNYSNERFNSIKNILEKNNINLVNANSLFKPNETFSESYKYAINKSDIIICDATGSNPNIMYDLGYAHGLDKPVILLAEELTELKIDASNYEIILLDKENKSTIENFDEKFNIALQKLSIEKTNNQFRYLKDFFIDNLPYVNYIKLMSKFVDL